jgi:hypothetical protein
MKHEEELLELYEQEYCESMTLPFPEFTYAVFTNNFKIVFFTTIF